MELSGGGTVCYAPSRLGKLVLRVTGFPARFRERERSKGSAESSEEKSVVENGEIIEGNDANNTSKSGSYYQETRHLYLGFHHPWDRDLWRAWFRRVSSKTLIERYILISKFVFFHKLKQKRIWTEKFIIRLTDLHYRLIVKFFLPVVDK